MLNTEKPSSFKDYAADSHMPYLDNGNGTKALLNKDYDNISRYIQFDEILREVSKTGYDYKIANKKLLRFFGRESLYQLYSNREFDDILIPSMDIPLNEFLPFNAGEYTPHIKAYFRWVRSLVNMGIDNIPYINKISNKELNKKNEKKLLESLIKELQSEQTKNDFKKSNKEVQRRTRILKNYIQNLIDYKANLLLIRLDLAYNKNYVDQRKNFILQNSDYQDFLKLNNERLANDLKEIKECKTKFFRAIKNKYNVVGYIWKLEYGLEKEFHYHCLIILDGDKHREDGTIAKSMGEMWKQINSEDGGITTKGVYWNCNDDKQKYKYKHLAIGQLNANNTKMIGDLFNYVLPYMAKMDYYIKSSASNDRSVGTGERKYKEKSGRPRKQ